MAPAPSGSRRVLEVLAGAVCPPRATADGVIARTVDEAERTIAALGAPAPAVLAAAVRWLDLSTVRPRYGWRRFSTLDADTARAVLDDLEAGRPGWWRVLRLLADVVVIGYYEQPEVRAEVGYLPDPWIAERAALRLERYAADIEEHARVVRAAYPLRPGTPRQRAGPGTRGDPGGRGPARGRGGLRRGGRGLRGGRGGGRGRAGRGGARRGGAGGGRPPSDRVVHHLDHRDAAHALPRQRCLDHVRPGPDRLLRGPHGRRLHRRQRRDGLPRARAGAPGLGRPVRAGLARPRRARRRVRPRRAVPVGLPPGPGLRRPRPGAVPRGRRAARLAGHRQHPGAGALCRLQRVHLGLPHRRQAVDPGVLPAPGRRVRGRGLGGLPGGPGRPARQARRGRERAGARAGRGPCLPGAGPPGGRLLRRRPDTRAAAALRGPPALGPARPQPGAAPQRPGAGRLRRGGRRLEGRPPGPPGARVRVPGAAARRREPAAVAGRPVPADAGGGPG